MKRKERAFTIVQGGNNSNLCDLSDDELMMLVSRERLDAFNSLVTRHQPRVLSFATRFLGDAAEGRDVTQDVFLYVWLDRHRYTPQGKFPNYLYRIEYHRCQVVARQRKRKQGREAGWPGTLGLKDKDSGELPLKTILHSEQRRLVNEALMQLGPEMRSVLILRITEALSYEDIVERTDLPPGTVRSHVSRGIQYLCRIVEDKGFKGKGRTPLKIAREEKR